MLLPLVEFLKNRVSYKRYGTENDVGKYSEICKQALPSEEENMEIVHDWVDTYDQMAAVVALSLGQNTVVWEDRTVLVGQRLTSILYNTHAGELSFFQI